MNDDLSCELPGSGGEHDLQERLGTSRRAAAFYNKQMLDHLNPLMLEYLARQEMAFISTADAHGECDCSFRAGPPGFIRALDERTLIYPELRGNGVMASMGNMAENPYIGILFVDFFDTTIGLHVNGRAGVIDDEAVRVFGPMLERLDPTLFELPEGAKTAEQWVVVHVEEAYIHCSKHIPLMTKLDKDIHWATDDNVRKGGDFFKAKHSSRPWVPGEPVTAQAATANVQAATPEDATAVPAPDTEHVDVAPVAQTTVEPNEPVEPTPPQVESVDPGPLAVAQAPGLALAEAAAARAVSDEPSTSEPAPLPDWAFEFASMSDVDWSRVADIARRIGELDTPDTDDGSATA
jgi:uncharacterized protein